VIAFESGAPTLVRSYELTGYDRFVSAVNDGSGAIAALVSSVDGTQTAIGLVRFEADGTVSWGKKYVVDSPECPACPIELAVSQVVSGHLIVARAAALLKIDASSGEAVWAKSFDTYNYVTQAVAQTDSQIFVMGPSSAQLTFTRLDQSGDPELFVADAPLPENSNHRGTTMQWQVTSLYANEASLTAGYSVRDNYAESSYSVAELGFDGQLKSATSYVLVDHGSAQYGEITQDRIYHLDIVRVDLLTPTPQGTYISDAYALDTTTNDGLGFLMEFEPSSSLRGATLLYRSGTGSFGAVDSQGQYARLSTGSSSISGKVRGKFGCDPDPGLVTTEKLDADEFTTGVLPNMADVTTAEHDFTLPAAGELEPSVSELVLWCPVDRR